MAITDYDTTASNNTTISGTNIDEGCSPAGINNAIRQVMADLADAGAVRGHLDLETGTDVQAQNATLQSFADNAPFALKSITTLTSGSGTYTLPTGCRAIEVEAKGGGSGGGGVNGLGSAPSAGTAGSGNPGGYCRKFITSPSASYTYAVGAGGAGGATGANNGTAGGDTTFTDGGSTDMTASGGAPGLGVSSTTGSGGGFSSDTPATATGGDINIPGSISPSGRVIGGVIASAPKAEGGVLGTGVANNASAVGATDGQDGQGYGSPGAGGVTINTSSDAAGGDGTAGVIIIREYY